MAICGVVLHPAAIVFFARVSRPLLACVAQWFYASAKSKEMHETGDFPIAVVSTDAYIRAKTHL